MIAHRGASRQRRENTLEAFRRARELGSDAVELDVRRSADGVLVVHHDPRLDDGRVIAATPASALPPHVPTLDAALDACEGMWVNVEVKNDEREPDFDPTDAIAVQTARLLMARREPASTWLVSSFRRASLDAVRAAAPEIATAWLCFQVDPGVPEHLAADGHVAVHPWVELLTGETIARCHAAGLTVNTWTCDDPQRLATLIAHGLDGVCTNVPDVARQVVDTGSTSPSTSGS